MQRCPVPAPGTYAYDCVGRRRSPPRIPRGHPLSPARSLPAEEAADIDHEPTKVFVPASHREACRLPENRDAFEPSCTRGILSAKRLLSPALTPALSLTPPTLFPQDGESALLGIASFTVRSPAIRERSTRRWFESTDTFFTPVVMPGTDDPSMPGSSTDSAVDGC